MEPVPHETPIDVSGLIPRHIASRAELSIVEAENVHEAVVKYLAAKPSRRQAPFTLPWLYKLHKEMFGRVWRWAGHRRQIELNIGVPHYQIDAQLQTLLDDLLYWRDDSTVAPTEQAVQLHHCAVYVHPFLNGNGRWARLLANIWLRRHGHPITLWPDDAIGQTSRIRREYIDAIKAADNGDYGLLTALHEKFRSP